MEKLIKTFDKNIAQSLKEKGFNYRLESINKQEVYVFLYTNKLRQEVSKVYNDNTFFTDTILRF